MFKVSITSSAERALKRLDRPIKNRSFPPFWRSPHREAAQAMKTELRWTKEAAAHLEKVANYHFQMVCLWGGRQTS